MKRSIGILFLVLVFGFSGLAFGAVSTFDDLPLATDPYWNGSDGSGGFKSGSAWFYNSYNSGWGSWEGWSYSNKTDLSTPGYSNQYSAYNTPNGGGHNSSNYGVFYKPFGSIIETIKFDGAVTLSDVWITNTTYVYKAIVEGDDGNDPPYSKKFGQGDWYKLTIWGFDQNEQQTKCKDIFLADYRSTNQNDWYALEKWTQFDLSSLGVVYGIGFDLSSTDTGTFGMNTPAYFAMDDLNYNPVPIPGAVWLFGSGIVGLFCLRRRNAEN
ncbi:MAG: DUF4465 domain-containing protein [Deltaproteobacteria bacterium]|nr:MAG: DUF4465 domain-containing protein [Deltaproteobacteria bacterium]